jgi:hypothetical protein
LTAALQLIGALRQIVAHGIAGDVVERVGFGDVFGTPSDHDPEFHFPIGFDRTARNVHLVIGTLQRVPAFEEQHRLTRKLHARLGRMIAIIQSDTHDLAGARDRRAVACRARHYRQGCHIDLTQGIQAPRLQPFRRQISDDLPEIAQIVCRIQHRRALGPTRANSH